MICSTRLLGCSGFVIGVGWLNFGVARSMRSLSGVSRGHWLDFSPDSVTILMHSAAGCDLPPHATPVWHIAIL